jgi:16S rRNA processing protein RimM
VDEPTVVVGEVTRVHGIRGEVAVRNRSDNPDRWTVGAVVHAPGGRRLTVASLRPHGDRLLVTFAGVEDRTSAEALRGAELSVPISELPALGEDEWWPHDLEGCAVRTDRGDELGIVTEVVFNPANDIWVVTSPSGAETLVPALRSVLLDVDVDAKRILVRAVPGLTVPEDPPEDRPA